MRLTWKAAWLVVASSVYILALATAAPGNERRDESSPASGPMWWRVKLSNSGKDVTVKGFQASNVKTATNGDRHCLLNKVIEKRAPELFPNLEARRVPCAIGGYEKGASCFASLTKPSIAFCSGGGTDQEDAEGFRTKMIRTYPDDKPDPPPDLWKELQEFMPGKVRQKPSQQPECTWWKPGQDKSTSPVRGFYASDTKISRKDKKRYCSMSNRMDLDIFPTLESRRVPCEIGGSDSTEKVRCFASITSPSIGFCGPEYDTDQYKKALAETRSNIIGVHPARPPLSLLDDMKRVFMSILMSSRSSSTPEFPELEGIPKIPYDDMSRMLADLDN